MLAIRDMERAGIDIITDGEIRRESYSNRFATALEGIDTAKPGHVKARSGHETPVPRVVGKIRRTGPVEVRDMQFLRANTDRIAKITLPGPFTMSQQAINEFYKDEEEMVMDYAIAVNAEARDLEQAGADIIQLDEPWLRNDPEAAKRVAVKAINRALGGPEGADHRAPVLRLCGAGAGRDQAGRLLVPAAARRQHGRADLHRGGAAQARPWRAEGAGAEEGPARRASISTIRRRRRRRSWPSASAPA